MTKVVLLAAAVLVFLNAVQSYVLLTANVDDVHNLVKQVQASPIVQEFQTIWSRASELFSRGLERARADRALHRRTNYGNQQKLVPDQTEAEHVETSNQGETNMKIHAKVDEDLPEHADKKLGKQGEGRSQDLHSMKSSNEKVSRGGATRIPKA